MAKTGPKPLAGKAFAARHAVRLNYTLVNVLDERKFRVRCNACGLKRIVESKNNSTGPRCPCTHKRQFYKVKRTTVTHTQELHDKGFTDYQCLMFGSDSKLTDQRQRNLYRHECGHEFSMDIATFNMCRVPCSECRFGLARKGLKSQAYYEDELHKLTRNMRVLGKYTHTRNEILHEYIKCGHKVKHTPDTLLRIKTVGRCPICNPTRTWHLFRIKGKRFKTRSLVEKDFIKYLVFDKGIPVEAIEYEPRDHNVRYYNPVLKRYASYTPDFKVGNALVEVKDLASLGLKEYHWQDKEEVLIVNRAKCEASNEAFGDYRTYVRIAGNFVRTENFWKHKEQRRLGIEPVVQFLI